MEWILTHPKEFAENELRSYKKEYDYAKKIKLNDIAEKIKKTSSRKGE